MARVIGILFGLCYLVLFFAFLSWLNYSYGVNILTCIVAFFIWLAALGVAIDFSTNLINDWKQKLCPHCRKKGKETKRSASSSQPRGVENVTITYRCESCGKVWEADFRRIESKK